MSNTNEVTVKSLRTVLQRFNEDLGQYINGEERYKLGRVLTIIDAAISDPEQRKAIKDLVQNEWWGHGVRNSESAMSNPHTDMRGLCLALGFDLYLDSNLLAASNMSDVVSDNSWVTERYKDILKTAK